MSSEKYKQNKSIGSLGPDGLWEDWVSNHDLPLELLENLPETVGGVFDPSEGLKKFDTTLYRGRQRRWIAGFLIFGLLISSSFLLFSGEDKKEDGTQIYVQEQGDYILPDETKVLLDAESELMYEYGFETSRNVALLGRAYFDVTKSSDPFVVRLKDVNVTVLGTRFSIDDKGSRELIVFVEEGSVAVSVKGGERIVLKVGDLLRVDKAKGTMSLDSKTHNPLAWKTGVFKYEETPLEDVIVEIGEVFGVGISIESEEASNCPITSTSALSGDSAEEMLQLIALPLNLRVISVEDGYVLRGLGCKG